MDRRLVLTAFAAAAATSAFAQTQQPQPIQATPQPTGTPAGSGTGGVSASAGALGQAEVQHLQQTLATGTVALQTSETAVQKAQNPRVKQFAQFERDEQTTIAEVLRSIQEPAATASSGAAAAASGASASASASGGAARAMATAPEIPADKARMMEELQQKSGAEFDRMYVQGQIQGHQELLQIQERYIQANTRNREQTNIAKLARGRIQEHIALLQDLQKELRG
jgi:putative membrane protein